MRSILRERREKLIIDSQMKMNLDLNIENLSCTKNNKSILKN